MLNRCNHLIQSTLSKLIGTQVIEVSISGHEPSSLTGYGEWFRIATAKEVMGRKGVKKGLVGCEVLNKICPEMAWDAVFVSCLDGSNSCESGMSLYNRDGAAWIWSHYYVMVRMMCRDGVKVLEKKRRNFNGVIGLWITANGWESEL